MTYFSQKIQPGSMSPRRHPHFDHLFKVGVLYNLSQNTKMPKQVREEAKNEIARYRQEGLERLEQRQKDRTMATKKKTKKPADASSEHSTRIYSGRGVIFCVADDREAMGVRGTTIKVIADAIEDALDNGHEDSEAIARWLTTSSFNYEPDKRVRFNSLLKAGDAIGAQMTRKLYNAYNELADASNDPELTTAEKKIAKAEATGFAEAVSIVLSPFSCEDDEDPRLVNWDMVDHITELFEKEQVQVRRARNGKPQ